jgi:predicted Zn-ribbon and HTH transcriptional regulator
MQFSEQTPRQRLIDLLTDTLFSSHQLAQLMGIPERQVEEHLTHIVKTIARDPLRTFVLEPSGCQDCGFVFRERRRLTRPSRCPRCRSEAITSPRYGIRAKKER